MSNNSPGQYSVSVSFKLPWKKEKAKTLLNEDKKRKKKIKPIINPIFETCASLTEDIFWQAVFMDCAIGKFPRGFTFKNNLLTHKRGSKLTTLEISNSPTDVFVVTMNFFQVTAGMMSEKDRQKLQMKEEEKLLEEVDTDISWDKIKKENLKEVLITEFITDISERMNFTEEEKKELTTTIKKGIMLKCFNANNIIMSEGKIIEIDGLIYNEETREYEIDEIYMPQKNSRKDYELGIEKADKKPDINFLEIWKKYLESLENKRNKKVKSFSMTRNDEDSKTYECSFTS